MNFENITDFSAKDSKEYNDSINLFDDAGRATSDELDDFQDTLYYKEEVAPEIKQKTHNAANFLDEDYLSKKKMNANTSAIQELTEELMFGSTEEDLDTEITEGGLAQDIANTLQAHGITGSAVDDTFKKVKTYFGKDPDIAQFADDTVFEGEEDSVDFEDTDDAEDTEEVAETEVATVEDESSDDDIQDIDESTEANLDEMFQEAEGLLKRKIVEKRLKGRFAKNKTAFKEALLVGPTGSYTSNTAGKRTIVGLAEANDRLDERVGSTDEFAIFKYVETRDIWVPVDGEGKYSEEAKTFKSEEAAAKDPVIVILESKGLKYKIAKANWNGRA